MKYTQLFFPVSLRGEQRHREVNNVPKDTQVVSHRADLNPNWWPLQWRVNTQSHFANCCGSSEAETRHFSGPLRLPKCFLSCPFWELVGGGGEEVGNEEGVGCSDLSPAKYAELSCLGQPSVTRKLHKPLFLPTEEVGSSADKMMMNGWSTCHGQITESVRLGPSTLKRKMDSQTKRIVVKQWRNNNNQHLTVPQAFKACLYISYGNI